MKTLRLLSGFCVAVLSIAAASPALGLPNRVFVSARSGNDANSCENVLTPCQTLAGAVLQVISGGKVIVLDSGGYGPVTITKAVTIQAAPGVTAFIHPPVTSDAIVVDAGPNDVTIRGLSMMVGDADASGAGINVLSVGTLNVENCFVDGSGGSTVGIRMSASGRINVRSTQVTGCQYGMYLYSSTGVLWASIDHCHFDGNYGAGVSIASQAPGSTLTSATYSTADNCGDGWVFGATNTGKDVATLEFCSGSEDATGLLGYSNNSGSTVSYSNCVFSNNGTGVSQTLLTVVQSRGNNTMTGNGSATGGVIGSFSPM